MGYVLMDLSTPNPFKAVVLAGSERMPSRNYTHEHSTSAEIRVAPVGMPQSYAATPPDAVLILVLDSNGSLSSFDLIAMHNTKTSRQAIRVNEAGELTEVRTLIDHFNAKAIDAITLREEAYHNRTRRNTTDGQAQHLARCNHACDRLASYMVTLGRQRELDFYTAHRLQPATRFYFSGSGLPLLGDPYEQIAHKCAHVHASRVLTQERQRDPALQTKTSTFLRLAAQGHVDAALTAKIIHMLEGKFAAEAIRSFLGRMSSTNTELATASDCVDATRIKAILKLTANKAPCIFCKNGTDSRTHWRFECEAFDHLHQYINQATSEHLAHCGYTFWFAPHLRSLDPELTQPTPPWQQILTDTIDHHTIQIKPLGNNRNNKKHLLPKERVATFAKYGNNTPDPATDSL